MILDEVREHLRTYISSAGGGPKEKVLLMGMLQHVEEHLSAMEVLHSSGHDETVFVVSRAVVESMADVDYLLNTEEFPRYIRQVLHSGMKGNAVGQELKKDLFEWFGTEEDDQRKWPDVKTRLSIGSPGILDKDQSYDVIYAFSSDVLHNGAMHILYHHLCPDLRFDQGVVALAPSRSPFYANMYEALMAVLAGWISDTLKNIVERWGGPMQKDMMLALNRCKEAASESLPRSAEACT